MPGFTATAFVKLLRLRVEAARSYLNAVRAEQDVKAFLVQQAVAALEADEQTLAEAIKLQNAIINEHEWTIQRDGSVRVKQPSLNMSMDMQTEMGVE